jgi:uncharacterized repeat protein (TIGR01451 family)
VGSPERRSLVGSGVPTATPAVIFASQGLDFPPQVFAASTAPRIFGLTNTGSANLTVSAITSSLGDFGATHDCTNVAPGASCALAVTFTPAATGSRTAILAMSSNATGSPHKITVSGTGVAGSGGAQADVAHTQSSNVNPALSGRDAIFTLVATNNGPAPATGVTITSTVPAGAIFIWSAPGCVHAPGTVTCNVGSIAAGSSASVKLVVRPTAAGSISLDSSVVAVEADPNGANNQASISIPVSPSPAGTPIQRYRLYSDVTKEHHFTTDLNEYNVLGTYVGTWVQEGTVGKILNNPGAFSAVTAVPYYRLYDNNTRWHHWTTDANEYYTLGLVYSGWNMEGVDGYILPTQGAGTIQLYRLNYPALGSLHHWTIDANEYNTLITPAYGWVGEGGSGFVVQ